MVESIKIKNLVTNVVKSFDMSEADYLIYEGAIDWGTVAVNHNTFSYPTQIGAYITNTVIGTRDISINGWIIGETLDEIEKKKNSLSRLINPVEQVTIYVGEYSISGKPSSNVTYGKEYAENNDVCCKFLIQILCDYPMFILTNPLTPEIGKIFGGFMFPLTIPKNKGLIMGYRQRSLFTTINNQGSISVGIKIKIYAHGTVNNIEIIDVNSGKKIRINKVLNSGEVVEIDTNAGNRHVYGFVNGIEQDYIQYFDYDSEWLQLQTGINTLTFRSYSSGNIRDESYKRAEVIIEYKSARYNIPEE